MSKADEYRRQAEKQQQAASIHLAAVDTDKPMDKLIIGLLGAMKASMFTIAADILDGLQETAESVAESTTMDRTLSRNHRLRMASLRGDQKTIDAIMQEIEDELRSKIHGEASRGSTGQPG